MAQGSSAGLPLAPPLSLDVLREVRLLGIAGSRSNRTILLEHDVYLALENALPLAIVLVLAGVVEWLVLRRR